MGLVAEKRSLMVLHVAEPCTESWYDMTPASSGKRHCELCAQDVFDLTRLSEAEIRAQVLERSGRVCVRFFERQDGTIVTADCTPVRHRRMRRAAQHALRPAAWLVRGVLGVLAAFGVARAAGVGPSSWFGVQPHVLVNLPPVEVEEDLPPAEVEEDFYLVMGLVGYEEDE